ncbi:hypothetical protein [Frigoribacterium sp. SL97]|uniref:hypothetical protein n=1 Tax=Frigoribacterium sp. SL97 TaxID=2994664 RepID=UPI0022705741|nr:hypothetical protein [Frigoribacterium sp. SL97]WAC52489.1 hypothetical protein OVA02_04250 [Frigoribacterium sp. SL97]
MAKDTTPDGRDDDRRDENTPAQDDAWAERLRREDEDQDARATTELPARPSGQPTAPTTPIVADDQRTRELPTDGSAFRAESTPRRRPRKGLLVGIGIAAAGLALVGTSTAVAVSNAGSLTSASSSATPGRDDATDQADGSRQGPGGRGSDDATGTPTDAPTPPAAGDDSDESTPAEGTGPDGEALPAPGTGPDGKALPEAPEGGPAAGGPMAGGPQGPGEKRGPGHGPGEKGGPKTDSGDTEDGSDRPTPPTDAPTPPTDAPTPTPGTDEGSGS